MLTAKELREKYKNNVNYWAEQEYDHENILKMLKECKEQLINHILNTPDLIFCKSGKISYNYEALTELVNK